MLPYLIQLLAQWIERPVTSREVACSSHARPTGSMVLPLDFAVCVRCGVRLLWRCPAVYGLRASRWACYCVSIAARCPPGLPSCNVSVAELADALDLGSSAFGRVGSTPTGHTSGKRFSCISLLPLAFRSCYSVSECGSPGWLNW